MYTCQLYLHHQAIPCFQISTSFSMQKQWWKLQKQLLTVLLPCMIEYMALVFIHCARTIHSIISFIDFPVTLIKSAHTYFTKVMTLCSHSLLRNDAMVFMLICLHRWRNSECKHQLIWGTQSESLFFRAVLCSLLNKVRLFEAMRNQDHTKLRNIQ